MIDIEFVESIADIDADHWRQLLNSRYPFMQHSFLAALETSQCVGGDSGWQPQHLKVMRDGELVAAAPLYIKAHSWGEYVFDWAWADAFRRSGRNYYPKLLCAIPFTPASGPRLIGSLTAAELLQLQQQLEQAVVARGLSGLHWLLPDAAASTQLSQRWQQRETAQFHWFNEGFAKFDDFLATFNSRKRKSLLRERRKVVEQGLQLTRKTGTEISRQDWSTFYHCYHTTYLKRSGNAGYLNLEFFHALAEKLGDQLMMVCVNCDGQPVAASLCFFDNECLYGRYWGCLAEYECLHFEACYYQGIEFAIEQKLARFDPGAQGEHKIQRGFKPVSVYSNHWLKDADARAAIGQFIDQECQQTRAYLAQAAEFLPFKQL